jgi:hypothetical protein
METHHEVPERYRWLVLHRRLVVALVAGAAGFAALVIGWVGVSGTVVVADQLSYIASGGLIGLFLMGVAAIAYIGEQRERELARLTEIEVYLGAIAQALNLAEPVDVDHNLTTPARDESDTRPSFADV